MHIDIEYRSVKVHSTTTTTTPPQKKSQHSNKIPDSHISLSF